MEGFTHENTSIWTLNDQRSTFHEFLFFTFDINHILNPFRSLIILNIFHFKLTFQLKGDLFKIIGRQSHQLLNFTFGVQISISALSFSIFVF